MSVTTAPSGAATAIHPFHVDVPEETIDDLRRRIAPALLAPVRAPRWSGHLLN
jgi:hypothetical protein